MTDRARIRIVRAVAAIGGLLAIASLAIAVATDDVLFWWQSFAGFSALIAVAYAWIVWVAIPQQPRNRTVWAMSASAGCGVHAFTLAIAAPLIEGDPFRMLRDDWVPAGSGAAVGWLQVIGNAFSIPGLIVPLTLGLMVFPDGRLWSAQWRPVAVSAVGAIVVLAVAHGWWYRPGNSSRDEHPLIGASLVACVLLTVVTVLGLVVRYRHSTGTRRLQHKWIVWGATIATLVLGTFSFLPDSTYDEPAAAAIGMTGAICWVAAYGFAVTKHRLYDIDVVISHTVVYVVLAALITGIYVGVVVGLGSAIGGPSIWLSVIATALVALAFEPARTRLQRWANRLVYGERATPYEILGDLTGRLAIAESGEAVLARLADRLCAGTGAQRVTVWIDDGGTLDPVAVEPPLLSTDELAVPVASPDVALFPIEYDEEPIGLLTVKAGRRSSLRPADIQLAGDLASSAALVVHKLRLDRRLAATAADISESRRRLVGAQDAELRRLERQLESGIEGAAVTLREHLAAAAALASDEGSDRAATILAELGRDAADAVDQIRSLAHGIYPPMLDTDGLIAAIPVLAARSPLEVRVLMNVQHRHGAAVEAAVYFCVAEGLTNAAKHACGPVSIDVTDQDGVLEFTVTDAGPGCELDRQRHGTGLHNMRDRLDALGGELVVTSRRAGGTTVRGRVPTGIRPCGADHDRQRADQAATISPGSKADFERKPTAPAATAWCSYSS